MSSVTNSQSTKEIAERIIQRRVLYATGLGLIPLPVVDVASIFATQVLMVKEIAVLYGLPFDKNRTEAIIGTLVGDLTVTGLVKSIPVVGQLFGGFTLSVSAAAATYAIGRVFVEHFNQGGTLLSFDPKESRAYFQQLYDDGSLLDTLPAPQKRRRSKITIMLWVLILIFGGGIALYLHVFWKNATPPPTITKAYLDLRESQPAQANLRAVSTNDTVLERTLASFETGTAEGEILQYMQQAQPEFPRRFRLNRVQFTGNATIMGSPGHDLQLKNIAAIMKKYPDLIADIYGHTDNRGAKLIRQRVGRERARLLRDILIDAGVVGSRVTGNHLEVDAFPAQLGYWGAEIVFRVEETEIMVDTLKWIRPF